jgi:hypothetical protein
LHWEENAAIPPCVAALLGSLRFSGGRVDWSRFSEAEWKAALYYFDRNQLTLLLRAIDGLPKHVQRRLDSNFAANQERNRRLGRAFDEAAGVLQAANIDFLVLKGFVNWEQFWREPAARLQYDLDLFCPWTATPAQDTLIERLGYAPIGRAEQFPTDHLPALVRKTGWQWRGDFFDPEIPISVELHFRLWDESTEAFPAPGTAEFWSRRERRRLGNRAYFALDPVDALCYNALHLLRHLLRGDVRAANIYELAYFLHRNADDDVFWRRWSDLHAPELRRLQSICFRLAGAWFDCRLGSIARAEVEALPASVQRWFEHCAASPAEAFYRPNKDELWLHLCLLDSFAKKSAALRRRLLPTRLPGPLDSVFIPKEQMTWGLRLRKRWQYARYVARRGLFHARALLPTVARMLMTRS